MALGLRPNHSHADMQQYHTIISTTTLSVWIQQNKALIENGFNDFGLIENPSKNIYNAWSEDSSYELWSVKEDKKERKEKKNSTSKIVVNSI